MSFQELIAEIDTHGTLTNEQLAKRALRQAQQSADFLRLLYPLILNEVITWRRNHTRRVEIESFAADPKAPSFDPLLERATVLDERLYIPGRGYVLWGEATIEDHQARIAYLTKLSQGLVTTIERHQIAIAEIQAANARCLNDLYAVAA